MRNKLIIVFSVLAVLLNACSSTDDTSNLKAVGGKLYGGELKFMSSEKISSLSPIETIDVFAQRVTSQIYEPLFEIDPATLKVLPNIAESFTIQNNGKEYIIKIRKGVFFHEDDCISGGTREVTAEDVKFSLDLACSGLKQNQVSYLLVNYIKGAKEFMKKSKSSLPQGGVSGIKVVDKNTVKISLNEPFTTLDKILTHTGLSIIPKEAFETYGADFSKHPVGTGPFILEKYDEQSIVLKRNPNYWKKDNFGNQLPFLAKIEVTYSQDKRSELLAFRKKAIDMVLEIPVEEIDNILGTLQDAQLGKNVKHKVENEVSLNTSYIAFANKSPEFKDVRVRRAFNIAVNRKNVVETYLKGEGYPVTKGFVAPMETYHNEALKGFEYNPTEAKRLLAEAGYPNGKGFPALDIYVNAKEGSKKHRMIQGVVDDINRNLNVKLKIKLCTLKERDEAIAQGKAKIWRASWIADYPDPESFLSIFYSANLHDANYLLNGFKFKNADFDKYYEKALKEIDPTKRNEYLVKCDQIVIDEAAVLPILTDDFIVMVNARVRDFKASSMETLDFTKVFIKEPRK